jgi:uncharacterized protein
LHDLDYSPTLSQNAAQDVVASGSSSEEAMRRNQVIEILRAHREDIHACGARSLALFGSVARDEATELSDVDILVEFEGPATLDGFMGLKEMIELWLGVRVDLVTPKALKPRVRAAIEAEALNVA